MGGDLLPVSELDALERPGIQRRIALHAFGQDDGGGVKALLDVEELPQGLDALADAHVVVAVILPALGGVKIIHEPPHVYAHHLPVVAAACTVCKHAVAGVGF